MKDQSKLLVVIAVLLAKVRQDFSAFIAYELRLVSLILSAPVMITAICGTSPQKKEDLKT